VDEGFRCLPGAAIVDGFQPGIEDFQQVAEVIDIAFVVVRRIDVRIFFGELGCMVAVGERVAQREIGAPDAGLKVESAGGRGEREQGLTQGRQKRP